VDVKAIIRELLIEHDCVIIPGFGGFIANNSVARYERVTGTFYPPVRKISFNRNLTHNDGLLISRISRSSGLNYGDARRIVDEFAGDIMARLEKRNRVLFDHIGAFTTNYENSVQFEPEADMNYLSGSYGLESFQCYPLKEYDLRKRVTRSFHRDPARQIQVRKTLLRAAIAIPVIALTILVPLKTDLFRTKVESLALNPLVTAEFENNRKAVDESAEIISVPEEKTAIDEMPLPEFKQPVPEEKQPLTAGSKRYGIVTGSFRSEENARTHIEMLKAEGFNPEIVPASNGFFRVFAIYCSDLETAIIKKDSLSGKFPDTWVSKR